jgi:hypothetical protein
MKYDCPTCKHKNLSIEEDPCVSCGRINGRNTKWASYRTRKPKKPIVRHTIKWVLSQLKNLIKKSAVKGCNCSICKLCRKLLRMKG